MSEEALENAQYKVELMTEADIDQVISIGLSTPEFHTDTSAAQFYSRQTLLRWVNSPELGVLAVVREGERVIGFMIAGNNPASHDAYLHCLVVLEEYRRHYIGRKLIQYTIEKLKALQTDHAFCIIQEANSPIIQLLQQSGFEIGGTFKIAEIMI